MQPVSKSLLVFKNINPLIIIPGRLNSGRLPQKVLADIEGQPMIRRVYERALTSHIGPVIIACDGHEIAWEIEKVGGEAILTDPELPSGSDRAYAALMHYDPHETHDAIICVQGDSPTIDPHVIVKAVQALDENPHFDIVTLAALITDSQDFNNTHVVKIALSDDNRRLDMSKDLDVRRALYFSRSDIPYGDAPKYHHIGLYAYRRKVLQQYIQLPPSPLELSEKLEQLRALEAGMTIGVVIVDTVPLGVDTAHDLEKAREYYRNL